MEARNFNYIYDMKTITISFMKYFSVILIGFFAPISYAFTFTFILVFTDTITGIMKAGKESVNLLKLSKHGLTRTQRKSSSLDCVMNALL
jgi:hypothetical protein